MEQIERKRGGRLLLRVVLALLAGTVWWLANRHAHGAVLPVRRITVHDGKVSGSSHRPLRFGRASRSTPGLISSGCSAQVFSAVIDAGDRGRGAVSGSARGFADRETGPCSPPSM